MRKLIPSLESTIDDNGARFSSGQKQLICLARAAIDKCKILVMDEATSNLDLEADRKLHQVVDDIFNDCTVLKIAHRMDSILNCDKVLVLDNGKLVECDSPKVLISTKHSLFRNFFEKTKMD